jgi:hypothetical protein
MAVHAGKKKEACWVDWAICSTAMEDRITKQDIESPGIPGLFLFLNLLHDKLNFSK